MKHIKLMLMLCFGYIFWASAPLFSSSIRSPQYIQYEIDQTLKEKEELRRTNLLLFNTYEELTQRLYYLGDQKNALGNNNQQISAQLDDNIGTTKLLLDQVNENWWNGDKKECISKWDSINVKLYQLTEELINARRSQPQRNQNGLAQQPRTFNTEQ